MPKKTSAPKKKPKQTKASFIRAQPAGMSAKDVIAKAKEAGITLTEDAVYKTRSLDKARAKKKSSGKTKVAGRQVATKKAPSAGSPTPRGKSPEKKDRVLALKAENPEWTADQIAKAAKCSTTYVYSVWGGSTKRGVSANGSGRARSPVMQHLDHVRALRTVILHVGIDRAKEMMDQIVKDLSV